MYVLSIQIHCCYVSCIYSFKMNNDPVSHYDRLSVCSVKTVKKNMPTNYCDQTRTNFAFKVGRLCDLNITSRNVCIRSTIEKCANLLLYDLFEQQRLLL